MFNILLLKRLSVSAEPPRECSPTGDQPSTGACLPASPRPLADRPALSGGCMDRGQGGATGGGADGGQAGFAAANCQQ